MSPRVRWTKHSIFGVFSAGQVQCTGVRKVPRQHGDWFVFFTSISILDDPSHRGPPPMSACLAFVLQRVEEIAATDICFGLKEGRTRILLSELSLVTVMHSECFFEFYFKPKSMFCFQFKIFFYLKKRKKNQ